MVNLFYPKNQPTSSQTYSSGRFFPIPNARCQLKHQHLKHHLSKLGRYSTLSTDSPCHNSLHSQLLSRGTRCICPNLTAQTCTQTRPLQGRHRTHICPAAWVALPCTHAAHSVRATALAQMRQLHWCAASRLHSRPSQHLRIQSRVQVNAEDISSSMY